MGKLKEILEKVKNFIQKFSPRTKKIIISAFIILVLFLSFFLVYSNVTKYGLLYSDLDPSDSKYIHEQLVDMGLEVKIRGKSIYVLRNKVDELRLTFSPELKGGSKGFELLDKSSGFGYTDEEFLIQKQRIVQGELERTIRSFSQVKDARVHISPSRTSVFMTDKDPAKASVYLKLNPLESLSRDQVKSIIHLVSAAWNNLSFENVEVVDSRMNLLSLGIYDGSDDFNFAGSLDNQMNLERKFEHELESRILSIIEPVLGYDKVRVRVNAELDFDSKKKTEIIVDDNKVPVSEHLIKEENGTSLNGGGGPIDNNMSNVQEGNSSDKSSREESTTNYELSKQESTIIYAPGEIKRITASFVYDGNITQEMRENIESLINGVIGFNAERGDSISVVGMEFNGLKQEAVQAKRRGIIPIIVSVVVLIVILFLVRMFKKNKELSSLSKNDNLPQSISEAKDMIQQSVDENIKKNGIEDTNPENKMLEDAIKNYAITKPSQVVEIIKSWMMEDTR
ncbi:flagellar basal-body MS-ring/collar protein FliF [Candidatus Arthromitus sp. SFB-rat-Yit]|uniref:flagellar basal-body MS-ring/collar protein FliF n=1 Tax=Candidatus Arthromitus sp. SFB-rat-Yit TaxID=1041504 RepID=UPI000227A6F5|nr:flagellar basal-body MS-ring/collar protein FliF [Candidatus Arthromitus sp. SFB-rat-Yit]BAK81707.1 flagellar MS-ring protein [Candidatus Arthromitus sp. SFB-rat-Yit]